MNCRRIDLNCDMGESTLSDDRKFMPYISSCNIACGYHAGGADLIRRTVALAVEHNVSIGAHPSYLDRDNFGRVTVDVTIEQLQEQVRDQILLVKSITEEMGGILHHVKPHGALYHDIAHQPTLAKSILPIIKEIDPTIAIYLLSGSESITITKSLQMSYYEEAFADRAYDTITALRPRSQEGAVLTKKKEVLDQVKLLLKQNIRLYHQELKPLSVDTICLHSDTDGAASLAQSIYQFITELGITIRSS